MNTYIQDKLDEFDKFVDSTYEDEKYQIEEVGVCRIPSDEFRNILEQSLTDYHDHIVEILEKERQTWAKESIGEVAVKSIINRLQDTNPKE